jgi:hypothetical protein
MFRRLEFLPTQGFEDIESANSRMAVLNRACDRSNRHNRGQATAEADSERLTLA